MLKLRYVSYEVRIGKNFRVRGGVEEGSKERLIFDEALSNLSPDSDHGITETPDPNIQIITKNRELLVEHDGPKFPTGQP